MRQVRMVLCKIILNVREVFGGCKGPSDTHRECASGVKHAFDSRIHLFELTAVGLLHALADTGAKTGVVFK
ncbi:MAG: hypothetical protein JWO71_169 [Candidatus Acidoferrum typicum]|nr:hypothetical protein [Candidatus Acidoferrum typicum]